MGIIFDTSVLITIERNAESLERVVGKKESEPFGISTVTAAELLHGVYRADSENRRIKRGAFVEKILEIFPIYPFDLAAARIYAEIWANFARKGIRVGSHDLLIASTAISIGFSVITSDTRDYKKIHGLKVEEYCGN